MNQELNWKCNYLKVTKYENSEKFDRGESYETKVVEGNLITLEGMKTLWKCITQSSDSFNYFDQANTRIGIGNGSTPATINDTDLNGSSKVYQSLVANGISYDDEAGSTASGNSASITLKAQFDGTTANYEWNEWGIFNGDKSQVSPTVPVVMLNHKVESMGIKVNGSVWVVEARIQLQNASN